MEEERQRPLLRSEQEALKPILTLEDLAKRLGIGQKEIRSVTLEGKHYGIPFSHAVESNLLELFARKGKEEDGVEQQNFLEIVDDLTRALKEVELCLVRKEQHATQSIILEEASSWKEDAEHQAVAAIRCAEDILRKHTLLTREEKRKIKDIRRESPARKDIVRPDEILG